MMDARQLRHVHPTLMLEPSRGGACDENDRSADPLTLALALTLTWIGLIGPAHPGGLPSARRMLHLSSRENIVKAPTKTKTWEDLLDEAAVGCDVEVDAFVRGAWAAYVDARPGMRERLEEAQLRAQLDELRKSGQIAQA